MPKPAVLLTGQAAGTWYTHTLHHVYSGSKFDTVQIDFAPINALLPNRLIEAATLLEPYFKEQEKKKQPYILANITLHEAVQYFSFTPKYFISIGNILQKELRDSSDKLIILGTKYTMNHSYIPSLIPGHVVEQLPEDVEKEVEELRKIYNDEGDRERSIALFQKLEKNYIDYNFMIACTELAMVLRDANPSPRLKVTHLPLLQCTYLKDGTES